MAQVSGRRNIVTGTLVPNLLTGQVFETVQEDSLIEIALIQGAAAASPHLGLIFQVACDGEIVLQDVNEVNAVIKSTAPIYPDDYALSFLCVAGSKLYVQVRNNSAGDLVVFYGVRVNPA